MYPKPKDLKRDVKSPLFRCGHQAEWVSLVWALGNGLGRLWCQHFPAGNWDSVSQCVCVISVNSEGGGHYLLLTFQRMWDTWQFYLGKQWGRRLELYFILTLSAWSVISLATFIFFSFEFLVLLPLWILLDPLSLLKKCMDYLQN